MYQRLRSVFVSPNFVIATALFAGAVGLAVATLLSNPYTTVVPPLLIVGGAAGLFVKNRELHGWELAIDPRIPLIGYLTTATATIALYTAAGFTKGAPVFVLVVVLFFLSALLIFVLDSVRLRLGLIVSTAVLYRVLVYYASAVQMGADALFHNRAAGLIAESGTMAPLAESKYWYAPVYHLFTASGVTALDLPARDAAFLLVTVVATVVPAFVVFQLLERTWDTTTGLVGSFLFVTADRVVFTSIHTTTTTLGVVLFSLLLLYTERYLESRSETTLVLFLTIVGILTFTHQLSMFAALAGVGVYLVGYMLWEGTVEQDILRMLSVLFGAFLLQSAVTKYGGPASSTPSFLVVVSEQFMAGFVTAGSRASAHLPPGSDYVLSGSPSMSVLQVVGTGLFLALGVVGTVYWMNRSNDLVNRMALDLTFVVALVSFFLFVGPMVGVQVFVPDRWFSFLYLVLAILAAPGIVAILSTRPNYPRQEVVTVLLCLVIFVPFSVFMLGSSHGAPDNPVIDDSPGAGRIASTQQETTMYQHIDDHGGDTRVLADVNAWHLIHRHYNHEATVYSVDHGEPGTSYEGEMLIAYREYTSTKHARYDIMYQGQQFRVVGPLPERQAQDSIVYTNGPDQLVWRVEPDE